MHELYDLKEMLCKELEEYGRKGEMTAGSLEVIDKLTHALKNLDKVIESKEMDKEEYSGAMRGGSSSYRGVYDDSPEYERGTSYARARGGNARRDSMGRYSRNSYARRRGGYSRMDKMEGGGRGPSRPPWTGSKESSGEAGCTLIESSS